MRVMTCWIGLAIGLVGCGQAVRPVPADPPPERAAAVAWLRAVGGARIEGQSDEALAATDAIVLHHAPTDAGLAHLRAFPHLTRLEIWDTGDGPAPSHPVGTLDDRMLEAIARLEGLESLAIGGWNARYTDTGLRHVAMLRRLVSLNLCQAQRITDDGMRTLATLPALRTLGLTYTKITDEGLAHLLAIETLTEVDYGWAAASRRALARFQAAHPERRFLR